MVSVGGWSLRIGVVGERMWGSVGEWVWACEGCVDEDLGREVVGGRGRRWWRRRIEIWTVERKLQDGTESGVNIPEVWLAPLHMRPRITPTLRPDLSMGCEAREEWGWPAACLGSQLRFTTALSPCLPLSLLWFASHSPPSPFPLDRHRSHAAKARRYTSPDEHPFTPRDQLPTPVLVPMEFPSLLHPPASQHPSVNVNDKILDFYVRHIVPGITKDKDDNNYGSSATRDVEVLQALSRRIHFGESGC